MKKIIIFLGVLIVLLTGLIVYVAIDEQDNIVESVVDGDTFRLSNGQAVRLLGIDSPERGEHYYQESRSRLAELVKNKQVFLEKDKTDKDRYGRLLRYVYVEGVFVNLVLVEEGYARAHAYKPDERYREKLEHAERLARVLGIGIWGNKQENICCTALGCDKQAVYVGSKNSKKYHDCCSRFARMISKENMVCFRSKNEAIIQGYEVGDVK